MLPPTFALRPKLPDVGITIFTTMSRLAIEHGAINLSQGFPDYNTSSDLVDLVSQAMRDGHNQYAPMAGVPVLREALSDKIAGLYGRRYDPESEITVTGGATEALYSTLTAFVHPGDEVVLFQPAYDLYAPVVRMNGGIPVFVTMHPPDFAIDWDAVRRVITPRTRAIVVNSPHNPTGMMLGLDDIRALERVLEHTDAIVIADEAYEHIVFDGARHESLSRHPVLADRAVVIGSFGKTFHATGWKIGWAAAPRPLSAEVRAIHQWVTFAINGAVQMAYAEALRRDPTCGDVAAFFQRKRDRFRSLMAGSRFDLLPCRGTFFQMASYAAISSERDTDFTMRLLRDHGVATIPPSAFLEGVEGGPLVRFCFAKRDETLDAAAARLRAV